MTSSENDKYNDRVFGTAWLGIGILILWIGVYMMIYLPNQGFSDISYFCALIFLLLGSNQVRRGRDMKQKMKFVVLVSNFFYVLSIVLYCYCLWWFKANHDRILNQSLDLSTLQMSIITSFILLTIAVILNFTPMVWYKKIQQIKYSTKS